MENLGLEKAPKLFQLSCSQFFVDRRSGDWEPHSQACGAGFEVCEKARRGLPSFQNGGFWEVSHLTLHLRFRLLVVPSWFASWDLS